MKKRNAALAIVIALVALSTIVSLSIASGATPLATPKGNDATSPTGSPLTETGAEDLALAAVGLSRDDVIWERTEYDRERGQDVWEVEFYHDGVEYDFEINADTGEILQQKQDQESKPETNDRPNQSADAVGITQEDALAIALADAGFTAEQVTRLTVKKDYDDGAWEYEIEFYQENTEYDYTVAASDGKITERDIEQKSGGANAETKANTEPVPASTPEPTPEPTPDPSPDADELTQEQAVEIALADAGLAADQVTRLKVEKDRDDGVWVYEIEFHQDRLEYDYEIRINDRKITERDIEWDD